jgi:nitroreductase
MECYDVINKRRTVRNFSAPAPEEILRKIILAGTKAINADNRQPWEFIILSDPELINKIAELKYQCNMMIHPRGVASKQKALYRNTSAVAVCFEKGGGMEWTAWAAIENMALAATAEGYGILPSSLWMEPKKEAEKLLGLPEEYLLAAVVLVGKQKGKPLSIKRRSDFTWLHRNKFGNPA